MSSFPETCPYWADGVHLFVMRQMVAYKKKIVLGVYHCKACQCGATIDSKIYNEDKAAGLFNDGVVFDVSGPSYPPVR